MEDEIAQLRQALADEQRRREEEQRRREEAESRASVEQHLREEEQRRREEAESRALVEQHRREEAEEISRPQTLEHYLEACHSLSLSIQVVTDRSLTTQGDTTDPVGRIYPRRIVPWDNFLARQEEIWDQLADPSFALQYPFPNKNQLNYVQSFIRPISSELGLRYFEGNAVENAVQKLVDGVYETPLLRERLGLRGTVTFESHTNLGIIDSTISESLQSMSLAEGSENPVPGPTAAARQIRPKAKGKGKGGGADQFCIYRTVDGANTPTMAIEYKAPHKLSQDEVVTGLASEIQPEQDVINKHEEGFVFASKSLAAAVITQLFSYMIGKGLQYGYVCTGQAFVFLYIPDDPSIVYYSVCIPNLDVLDDDENRLHRTAVAQVFAFVLQALRTAPPPLSWHDAAAKLDIWDVEYDDVLSRIPVSVRKDKQYASPYKPQRWRGFKRSPIRTRLFCQQLDRNPSSREEDDNEEHDPPSPTPDRQTRSSRKAITSNTSSKGRQEQRSRGSQQGGAEQERIQDRLYCTHQCLLGLAYGGPIDASCPNVRYHGLRHIGRIKFLRLLRAQLAIDRGPNADAAPLYLSGSVGSLFKVRLSSSGYTLVAKGVEAEDFRRLQHEKSIYNGLRTVQGIHVPVCLGLINLVLPYYYDGGEFEHFLLLSWAGRSLSKCSDEVDKTFAVDAITKAYARLHQLRILHGDAAARNILYDKISKSIMVTDFERAEHKRSQPLITISPNSQNQKKKPGLTQKQNEDAYEKELRSVREIFAECYDSDVGAIAKQMAAKNA